MQKPPILTAEEHKEFRSIAGFLQWLGSQARPDLCPATSLSNHGQSTAIHDLKTLAETLQFAKDAHEYGFIFQDVPVNENSVLLTPDLHRCFMGKCRMLIIADGRSHHIDDS